MTHNIVLNEKVSGSKKCKKALKMYHALISRTRNVYTQLDVMISNSMILLPRKYEDDHALKNTIIL